MSMITSDVNHSAPAVCPECDRFLFGNSVQARRQELGLSLFEAADLSGLTVWQWAAIEEGAWVPAEADLIRAMAGTLEANTIQMIVVAGLSAWALSGRKPGARS